MKNGNKKNSKPTIGLLISQLEESYQSRIWPGIVDYAQEHDVNLLLFVGKSPHSPYEYDYQHNSIYKLVNKSYIDGLVVISGNLGNFLSWHELVRFYRQFKKIPMVSIALEIPGIPSVTVDNESGIRKAIVHLIEKHGYKNIAFIRGPTTHQEAELRFHTYLKILKEYHLNFRDELTYTGDMIPQTGADAIHALIDEQQLHFDAIVAANDNIALGAIKAMQERGLRVPKDIAVVGFDDIDEAGYITPPLTTVKQPLYDQSKTAIRILLDMIEGNKVSEKICLPTTFVIRESCGCFHESIIMPQAAKHANEKSKEEFELALKKMKSPILNNVMKSCSAIYMEIEHCAEWIRKLIDGIAGDLVNTDETEYFIQSLNEILIQKMIGRFQYNFWEDVLLYLKQHTLQFLKDFGKEKIIEYLFEKGLSLLKEMMMRALYYRRVQVENDIVLLGNVSQVLITAIELYDLMNAITQQLPKLNIFSCYIIKYISDQMLKTINTVKLPSRSELVLAFDREKQITFQSVKKEFRTRDLLPGRLLSMRKRQTLVCMPLFFRDEKLGYVLFELGPREGIIYETLRSQISSALKGVHYYRKQQEQEAELTKTLILLEDKNKELKNLSLQDELTQLYNRRAFLTLGEQHLRLAQRSRRVFLLFFADMDGLKSINDTYGHGEGDIAILKASEILKQSFRHADIISRFGGDEFTIIAYDASIADAETLKNNLMRHVEIFNTDSGKSYKLGITMGVSEYSYDSEKTFEQLLSEADHDLYIQKKKKAKP